MADELPDPVPDVVVDPSQPIYGTSKLRGILFGRWWFYNELLKFVDRRNPIPMKPDPIIAEYFEKPVDKTG